MRRDHRDVDARQDRGRAQTELRDDEERSAPRQPAQQRRGTGRDAGRAGGAGGGDDHERCDRHAQQAVRHVQLGRPAGRPQRPAAERDVEPASEPRSRVTHERTEQDL
jgi:hypothetical protein